MNNNMETLTPLQRFFGLLRLDRKDISYIYIYAIFSGLITLSLPLGIQAIIGLIAGGALSASLLILIAIVSIGTMLVGILKVMQLTVTETIQRRIFIRASFDFAQRLPRLKLDSLLRYHAPELVNRFFDTLTLQKGIPKILVDLSSAVLQILFGLILISLYHPFFIFFALTLILVVIFIFWLTGPQGLKTSLRESKYKYEMVYWLEEVARAVTTFKLSGQHETTLRKTDDIASSYLDSRKLHFRILLTQYGWMVAFKTVITAGLLFLGSWLVINNQINIGQFVAAEIVVILIMSSVEKLILSMETIYDVLTGLEKLGAVMDMPIEEETGEPFLVAPDQPGMAISIRNLHFKYADLELPVLNGINLDIKPGQKVCIIGFNRSGKKTLLQLIAGMFSDYQGSITYNGIPRHNLNLTSLRSQIGDFTALEDLFRGSIIENIILSKPDATLNEVVKICQRLEVHEFIQQLPEGYETEVQPGGKNFPQSIRVRLLMARCLINEPQLLAVEGFFRGLSPADRVFFTDILLGEQCPWTVVAVTDSLDFAQSCDRTILIEKGEIVLDGPFETIQNHPKILRFFN